MLEKTTLHIDGWIHGDQPWVSGLVAKVAQNLIFAGGG